MKKLFILFSLICCALKPSLEGKDRVKLLRPKNVEKMRDITKFETLKSFLNDNGANESNIGEWEDNEGKNWFMCFMYVTKCTDLDEICMIVEYFAKNMKEDLWNRDNYGNDFLHYIIFFTASLPQEEAEERIFKAVLESIGKDFCNRENKFGITHLFLSEQLELGCFVPIVSEMCQRYDEDYQEHKEQMEEFQKKINKAIQNTEESIIDWQKRETIIVVAKHLFSSIHLSEKKLRNRIRDLHPFFKEMFLNACQRKNGVLEDNDKVLLSILRDEEEADETELSKDLHPDADTLVDDALKDKLNNQDISVRKSLAESTQASDVEKCGKLHQVLDLHLSPSDFILPDLSPLDSMRTSSHEDAKLGWIPPYMAVYKSNTEISAEVDKESCYGDTALIIAVREGHIDAVRELLDKGADINKVDIFGDTPLIAAARAGHADAVRELLERGAEVEKESRYGDTPLIAAARAGHADVVRELLERGVEVDKESHYEERPLIIAAINGHADVVRELLERGADINKEDKWGNTPLTRAAEKGHIELVRELLDKGADINKEGKYGNTPLITAAREGHIDIVRELLDKGADINKRNKEGKTPLIRAAREGLWEALRMMIQRVKIMPDTKQSIVEDRLHGLATIHRLARMGMWNEIFSINFSLEQINTVSSSGKSVLHYAVDKGEDVSVIQGLIEAGCRIDVRDRFGNWPAHKALKKNKLEVFKYLYLNMEADKRNEALLLKLLKSAKQIKSGNSLQDWIDMQDRSGEQISKRKRKMESMSDEEGELSQNLEDSIQIKSGNSLKDLIDMQE